jgi:ribosomal protein S14
MNVDSISATRTMLCHFNKLKRKYRVSTQNELFGSISNVFSTLGLAKTFRVKAKNNVACLFTGRKQSFIKRFGISRMTLRELLSKGSINSFRTR